MFTTIVVGVDGLQGGRDALLFAESLRERAGGALVAVHIHPSQPFPLRGLHADVDAIARDEAEALLHRELAAAGVPARAIVSADASPGRGIHRLAEELDADLLVVGTSHRGPVGRAVVGDNVRAVLLRAGRPVVVATHPADEAELGQPVIGVGYDGSSESREALAWGARLAEAVDGSVRVICTVDSADRFSPSVSYGINWVAGAPEREQHAKSMVAEAAADIGDRATGQVVVSPASDKLARLSQGLDLVVLGSRGYGPVRRTLLGSTSDRLVHTAACPVVVVPRGACRREVREHAGTDAMAGHANP
jgi:nucleotide-binding universal stress UspA family protein